MDLLLTYLFWRKGVPEVGILDQSGRGLLRKSLGKLSEKLQGEGIMCANPGDRVGEHPGAGAQWSGQNIENRQADHVGRELTAKPWAFIRGF